MRQSCPMSWKKTERVGLAVITTALLASEETKVPEDKYLKTRYIYCKADFPLSALCLCPWLGHITVKLKSLCLKGFGLRALPFIGAKGIIFMQRIILTEIMPVCNAEFLDKG